MKKVTIIIPWIRSAGVTRCIDAIKKNAGIPESDYEIIPGHDSGRIGCSLMVKQLTSQAKTDWVVFLGDDTIPEPDFLKTAIEATLKLPDQWGLIGFNDQFHGKDGPCAHWMAHKNLLKFCENGCFFHLGYRHLFSDQELKDTAVKLGRYLWAKEAKLVHDHPLLTRKKKNADYKRVYEKENLDHDRCMYLSRKKIRSPLLAVGEPSTQETISRICHLSQQSLIRPAHIFVAPKHSHYPADIGECRDSLCNGAINAGATHVVMYDSDQVFQDANTIMKMLDVAQKTGAEVVGAPVHRRWPPFEIIANRDGRHVDDEELESGEVIDVDSTGGGCLLIETAFLVKIGAPWFKFVRDKDGNIEQGEDYYFCQKVKENGGKILMDTSIRIDHVTNILVNRNLRDVFKYINQKEKE